MTKSKPYSDLGVFHGKKALIRVQTYEGSQPARGTYTFDDETGHWLFNDAEKVKELVMYMSVWGYVLERKPDTAELFEQELTDLLNSGEMVASDANNYHSQLLSTTPEGRDAPRRNYVDKRMDTEQAIDHAIFMVEHMAADPRLTQALNLLTRARNKVSDFVDGIGK